VSVVQWILGGSHPKVVWGGVELTPEEQLLSGLASAVAIGEWLSSEGMQKVGLQRLVGAA